jgi:hypothetical protein
VDGRGSGTGCPVQLASGRVDTSGHRSCSCITGKGARRPTCSFTHRRPPAQQVPVLAAVGTSPFGTEGERVGYCSRAPACQRPRLGDPRGPQGFTSTAPLFQRRRRRRRRAGAAGPAATTSVFATGQPHAPQDVDQRPTRPVCSSVAEPRPRRHSLARKPELRDSGWQARRWAG